MSNKHNAAIGKQLKLMNDALHVIILTPHIAEYLSKHDPKALEQAKRATLPRRTG